VADFLRTLSVQPFYVSFIDLVLFLPRFPLESFFPPSSPASSPPRLATPRFTTASGATTPCQDVKAVVKRRASVINHSRSRYYARNIRVLVFVAVSARWCVYTTFLSAMANPADPRFRMETLLARYYCGLTVAYDPHGSLATIALSSRDTSMLFSYMIVCALSIHIGTLPNSATPSMINDVSY